MLTKELPLELDFFRRSAAFGQEGVAAAIRLIGAHVGQMKETSVNLPVRVWDKVQFQGLFARQL